MDNSLFLATIIYFYFIYSAIIYFSLFLFYFPFIILSDYLFEYVSVLYFDIGNAAFNFFKSTGTFIVCNSLLVSGMIFKLLLLFVVEEWHFFNSFNSYEAVGRLLASFCKHKETNYHNSAEYSLLNLVSLAFCTFLKSSSMSFPVKGGLNAAISYSIHPNDHTSLFMPYGSSLHTSGLA